MSKPVGPYSPIFKAGDLFFTSGQIGLKDNAIVEGGIEAEFLQCLENLDDVLSSESLNKSQIVKATIFVTDLASFGMINALYEGYLGTHRPARSTVQVAALPMKAKIEIEAIVSA